LAVGQTIDPRRQEDRPHRAFFTEEIPEHLTCNSDYLARRSVESTFEQVRKLLYSSLPSRSQALFTSVSLADAASWVRKESRAAGRIYRVLPLAEAVTVILDLVWFNYAIRVQKGIVEPCEYRLGGEDMLAEVTKAASMYWRGSNAHPILGATRLEAIVCGACQVVEVVDMAGNA
jgi:hypothetical protein